MYKASSEVFRWKGKFVKKKVYDTLLQRSNNCKKRRKLKVQNLIDQQQSLDDDQSNCDTESNSDEQLNYNEPSNCKITGNRIVNLEYMSKQMYCSSCKIPLLVQNIEEDTVSGLGSLFKVRCHECLLINTVLSSERYISPITGRQIFVVNTKATLGAVHAGIGQSAMDGFVTLMDLPGVNSMLYKSHERIIGPIIELVAKESCTEATAEERDLTMKYVDELKKLLPTHLQEGFLVVENINTNEPPIVRVFVSYDMGWSMRGNGHTYDSLNGYCAIIGLKTGKVLDYCTKNRKCKQCDTNVRIGKMKQHDCRKNFDGSAKAMEASGAVQLVLHSKVLQEVNVQVGVLAGDNDSSSIAAIEEAADHEIFKQSDTNHSAKGVSSLLYKIREDKTQDPDNELSNDIINHIKRCFSYVIHSHKDSVNDIETGLINIPYHLFDRHDKCGSWCSSHKEKENLTGIRLINLTLFEVLKNLFTELSQNAAKFVGAPSSQANESLNNTMCSKARKSVCYSTSESADYRFAATVAQKNCGESYIQRSMDKASFFWSENLEKHVNKTDQITEKRRERRTQLLYKKLRIQRQAKRSQLKYQKENAEGETYQSHMALLDHQKAKVEDCVKIVADDSTVYSTSKFAVAFFDLETGGLSYKHDILQIYVKCGNRTFSSYITPVKSIDATATKVNGLSKVHKKLFLRGHEIANLPRQVVFKELLKYLQGLEKKCILVAHNCNFDSTRLIHSIQELSLIDEFVNIVEGFSDTLQLFRKKFPKRATGYKLTILANELLSLSSDGAHDAGVDVLLLEKLTTSFIDLDDIIKTKKSICDIINDLAKQKDTKKILPTFAPMKSIISKAMQTKLAKAGIDYEFLVKTFKTKGLEATKTLLLGEVNGKATIIKTKKILNAIVDHLIAIP